MAFVDEITLHLKAGNGGDGVVAWRHEKGREFMGPAGGDGGKGGSVFIKAVRDIGRLSAYRYGNTFVAGRGGHGQGKSRHGRDGADIEIEVPLGSVVKNCATERVYELLKEGERILVLRGGKGGFGNEHFKGSRNVRPRECTVGGKGERADFAVELRLIADAGIIGFPNAGKSSLLNSVTSARAKVGAYQFTTLEPNLGVFGGNSGEFILADIPGLIEGASEGKGLGHKFLRHIRRTKLLLHCISLGDDSPFLKGSTETSYARARGGILRAYNEVRKEIIAYAPELAAKKEVVVLTKADMRDQSGVKKAVAMLKKENKGVLVVSIIDDALLKKFKEKLLNILRKL